MIRPLTVLGLTAALAATSALADDPTAAGSPSAIVQQAFGSTIVSTYPDGRTAKLWLKRGGTYTAQGRRGDPSSGHWTVKSAKLCLKQAKPFWAPFSYCTPIPKGGMGQSWTAKAYTGETIQVSLAKGQS